MGRVYATADVWQQWTGKPPPDDAERRLARASEQIARATLTAVYDVDGAGMPTDPAVAEAFQGATVLQAYWWVTTGDEQGDAAIWQSASIGSVSLSGRRQTGSSARDRLAPQAEALLDLAGLIGRPAYTTGGC